MNQDPHDGQISDEILSDLGEDEPPKQGLLAQKAIAWGNLFGNIFDDIGRSILSFIPKGIGETYDSLFKKLPLIGPFFSKKWVDDSFKMIFGVTIGKGLSQDISYYIIRPFGFLIGSAFGSTIGYSLANIPTYSGSVGRFISGVAGQTIAGGLVGLLALLIGIQFQTGLKISNLGYLEYAVAVGCGGVLGFLAKAMMIFAIDLVTRANAAGARLNAKRAKLLGGRLKQETKLQSEEIIKQHAKEMIFQMNGPQLEHVVEEFFSDKFKGICDGPFKKIDRHLNYLTDRAVHGDIKSLKRLYSLYRKSPEERQQRIDDMLERVINRPRDIKKLKDEVDSLFDKWKYRDLYKNEDLVFS